MCSAICETLAALGPRLQWLRLQAMNHELYSLVPAILRHCPLLLHLEVTNVDCKAYVHERGVVYKA